MNWKDIPIPKKMQDLPRDWRGYPVPYFQAIPPTFKADLRVDFSVKDPHKVFDAMSWHKCGICGKLLTPDSLWAFVGGPDEIEQRLFSDPANHTACAEYAMKVCPFLNNPNYRPLREIEEGRIADPTRSGFRPPKVGIYYASGYEMVQVRPNGGPKVHPMPFVRPYKAKFIDWY